MKRTRLAVVAGILLLAMLALAACGNGNPQEDHIKNADYASIVTKAPTYTGITSEVTLEQVPTGVDDQLVKDKLEETLLDNKTEDKDDTDTVIKENDKVSYAVRAFLKDEDGNLVLITYTSGSTKIPLDYFATSFSYTNDKLTIQSGTFDKRGKELTDLLTEKLIGIDTKDYLLTEKDKNTENAEIKEDDILYVKYMVDEKNAYYLTIYPDGTFISTSASGAQAKDDTAKTTKATDEAVTAAVRALIGKTGDEGLTLGAEKAMKVSVTEDDKTEEKSITVQVYRAVERKVYTYEVSFPSDSGITEIAGKTATVEVCFSGTPTHYTVPELDEKFITETLKATVTQKDGETVVEAYTRQVFEDMKKTAEENNKQTKINALWAKLEANATVTPDEEWCSGWVKEQKNSVCSELQTARTIVSRYGVTKYSYITDKTDFSYVLALGSYLGTDYYYYITRHWDDAEEFMVDYFMATYSLKADENATYRTKADQVENALNGKAAEVYKRKILLWWLAKEEGITLDYRAALEEYIKDNSTTEIENMDETVANMEQSYGKEYLEEVLLFRKVRDVLIEKNTFTEKTDSDDTEAES